MSAWLARIQVTLKPVVNDPEGSSIERALHQLGFDGVAAVHSGKYFEVELTAADQGGASAAIEAMCQRLLANPVIEQYQFTLEPRSEPPGERRSST